MSAANLTTSKAALVISISISTLILNGAFANDLLTIYADALTNNTQLKSSVNDFRIVQEGLNEIASEYDPSLTFNMRPGIEFGFSDSPRGGSVDYGLSFTKPIYREQLDARLSQAEATLQKEQIALRFQKQQLIARVTKAYLGYVSAQNRLTYSIAEQQAVHENLRQLNTLFNSQAVTINEVRQVELLHDKALSAVLVARLELDRTRKDLQLESGRWYENLAELRYDKTVPDLQPSQLIRWINIANQYNYELLMARFDLVIEKKNIRVQQAEDNTSVDLFASYDGETGTSKQSNENKVGGKVGLEFNVPLYSGGRNVSKVRIAKLQAQKARYALTLKMQSIAQDVQLSFLTVQSSMKNVEIMQNSLWVVENALANSKTAKASGIATEIDVLSDVIESLRAKRDYIEAKYKLLADLVDLKLVAGVLSLKDLQSINALLTAPQQNFIEQASSIESRFAEAENRLLTLDEAWGLD